MIRSRRVWPRSLAKPGGNVTGVSYYATELAAKRLELLMEAIPELATVGVLANPVVSYLPFEEDAKRAAHQLGVALNIQQVSDPDELDSAFSRMKAEGAQAVFVLPDLMLSSSVAANRRPGDRASPADDGLGAMVHRSRLPDGLFGGL